jgi:hypothetical protein
MLVTFHIYLPCIIITNNNNNCCICRYNSPGNVTADELVVGKYLHVFGRNLLLLSADEFTQQYYRDELKMEQRPVERSDESVKKPVRETPPYTGYGDEDDSLASMKSLVPKPPKRDLAKLDKLSNVVLRFEAKYEVPAADEKDMRFVIAFYMGDDSLTIFCPTQRNSGITGGKYLERGNYIYILNTNLYRSI